jgi:hypothetical protein
MGMESLPSFTLMWMAMTAAMMAPSTRPFVVSHWTRRIELVASIACVVTAAWLLFGA